MANSNVQPKYNQVSEIYCDVELMECSRFDYNGEQYTNTFSLLLTFQLFINNEFVDAVSGKTFETLNPANHKVITKVAEGDKVSYNLRLHHIVDGTLLLKTFIQMQSYSR